MLATAYIITDKKCFVNTFSKSFFDFFKFFSKPDQFFLQISLTPSIATTLRDSPASKTSSSKAPLAAHIVPLTLTNPEPAKLFILSTTTQREPIMDSRLKSPELLFFPKIPINLSKTVLREVSSTPLLISLYILSQTRINVNDFTYIILSTNKKNRKHG